MATTSLEIKEDQVYRFDSTKQLGETDWPQIWLEKISEKLESRIKEFTDNDFYRNELTELFTDCLEVNLFRNAKRCILTENLFRTVAMTIAIFKLMTTINSKPSNT